MNILGISGSLREYGSSQNGGHAYLITSGTDQDHRDQEPGVNPGVQNRLA